MSTLTAVEKLFGFGLLIVGIFLVYQSVFNPPNQLPVGMATVYQITVPMILFGVALICIGIILLLAKPDEND